jgi:hypothetical protein
MVAVLMAWAMLAQPMAFRSEDRVEQAARATQDLRFTRPILFGDAPGFVIVTIPPAMAFTLVALGALLAAFVVVILLCADWLRPAQPLAA